CSLETITKSPARSVRSIDVVGIRYASTIYPRMNVAAQSAIRIVTSQSRTVTEPPFVLSLRFERGSSGDEAGSSASGRSTASGMGGPHRIVLKIRPNRGSIASLSHEK